jgi:MFS transporter, DHA2 family, triacylglyceride efflux pump
VSVAPGPAAGEHRRGRLLLGLAAAAVAFTAADNYVVVLALPDMMASSGLSAEQLQRGAPIISGFLLGFLAVLPLIGRIADVRGRLPVLVGCLVVFSIGSLVTAASYDLTSMVIGRLLQGVGAGGLIPATMALVADLYPPRERGIPLGVVGAVQEFGNVIGPVYGALVLAIGSWRTIFWINLAVAVVLAFVLRARGARLGWVGDREAAHDRVGGLLAAALIGLVLLVLIRPPALADQVTLGLAFVPVVGSSRWLSPAAMLAVLVALALLSRSLTARSPLLRVRTWPRLFASVDLPGSLLLMAALAGVILAFSTADPQVQVFSPAGPWLLLGSAVAALGFWLRNRSAAHPLIPRGTLAPAPAWGSMVVSFFVGSALIAALVDIPIFARVTVYTDSQLSAALVLVRFLVGLPIGAYLGGWWTHRAPAGVVTAAGMALAATGFMVMSTWGLDTLRDPWSNLPLVLTGVGIGLAMAPVNAALLSATASPVHGVASALLIVARTVGKLVGISVLTTVGLRRYYATQADLPEPSAVCPDGRTRCAAFDLILREAGLTQLHTIFVGAAVSCVVAGLVAMVAFRHADTRAIRTNPLTGHID